MACDGFFAQSSFTTLELLMFNSWNEKVGRGRCPVPSGSRAHDCALGTFPAELQAQGKLHNLLNWVLLLFLSPPRVPSILPSTRTDGKTDDNTPIRLFEALH